MAQAVAQGRPAFVDFTAAWGVTCQYNKATAIRTASAEQALEQLGYARFVADWTNRDAAISAKLNAFARTGVPLYLIVKRDGGPVVLPELLTEGAFIEALRAHAK